MGASPADQIRRGQSPLAAPNQPGPTLLGLLSLLAPQFRWTLKTFYSYPTFFNPLTASVTLTNQIQIDSQSHFILTYATCIVTDATNLIQIPFIPQLVQFIDSSSQSQLFQQATHAMNVYGDASQPGIFAIPYPISPSATFSVQHQNLEATNRLTFVALNGFKSYPGTDTRARNPLQPVNG